MEIDNRKTHAGFVCLSGGFRENADYAVVINIPAVGQAVSACGDIGPVAVQARGFPVL